MEGLLSLRITGQEECTYTSTPLMWVHNSLNIRVLGLKNPTQLFPNMTSLSCICNVRVRKNIHIIGIDLELSVTD